MARHEVLPQSLDTKSIANQSGGWMGHSRLLRPLTALVHRAGRAYVRRITAKEYASQSFTRTNERPIEYRFVFEQLNRLQPQTVLDVGTGTTALPQMIRVCGFVVTAIDNVQDYWPEGMFNRHFLVLNDDIRRPVTTGPFDLITCISTLEHIPEHREAVAAMFRLLRSGGHLLLSSPYNESTYSPNVYDHPEALYGRDSSYVCQSFSRAELDLWLSDSGGNLVTQEFWRCFTGQLWTFGALLRPPIETTRDEPHQLSCMVLRKP